MIGYKSVFLVMLFGFIIHWLPVNFKTWYRTSFVNAHPLVQAMISVLVIIFIYQILSADLQPFIYFAF